MKRWLVLAAALSAAASGGAQVPLSVDTTFRVDIPSQYAHSLAFMPDGSILASGSFDFPEEFPNGIYRRGMLKLDAQGNMDLDFPCCNGSAKITPWMDRYYVAGGQTVRRLQPDGTLDASFQHMNSDPYFLSLQGGDYHVFPDGRVLMGGYHTLDAPQLGYAGPYNLIWFTDEGRVDTTRTHRTGNGTVWGIKEYPAGTAGGLGGKFLVHQWGTQYEGQPVSKLIRVHEDGALDTSFHAPIDWGIVYSMVPLPDGRAYVGGIFRLEGESDTLQVVRLMPDGSPDPTFNNHLDFREQQLFGADARVICIYPIAPGLLVLGGGFEEVEGQPYKSICMVDSTGALVNTYFDGAGCGMYDYQSGSATYTYGSIYGMTRAPSGDYYIWGAYHGYTDGSTNDTLQRMVTRLHGGEIGLGVPAAQAPAPAMHLYPNPVSTNLTVELEQLAPGTQLVLRDALGKEVLSLGLTSHSTSIPLQGLPSGMYVVEILKGQVPSCPGTRLFVQP